MFSLSDRRIEAINKQWFRAYRWLRTSWKDAWSLVSLTLQAIRAPLPWILASAGLMLLTTLVVTASGYALLGNTVPYGWAFLGALTAGFLLLIQVLWGLQYLSWREIH